MPKILGNDPFADSAVRKADESEDAAPALGAPAKARSSARGKAKAPAAPPTVVRKAPAKKAASAKVVASSPTVEPKAPAKARRAARIAAPPAESVQVEAAARSPGAAGLSAAAEVTAEAAVSSAAAAATAADQAPAVDATTLAAAISEPVPAPESDSARGELVEPPLALRPAQGERSDPASSGHQRSASTEAAAPPPPGMASAASTALVSPQVVDSPSPQPRGPIAALRGLYRGFALRGRSTVVDDFGLDPQAAQRAQRLLDLLYRRYFRVTLQDVHHVPDGGRAILVGNRAGLLPLDGLMLMQGLHREHPAHREVRPLLEDGLFNTPYLGPLLGRIGAVRACPENAERLLRDEQLIAVFPEGQRGGAKSFRERYRLQRFGRGGFIRLALRTRTPLIPVAIVGAEEAQPVLGRSTWLDRLARPLGLPFLPLTPTFPWLGPLGLLPLPTRWSIAFGPPLHLYTEHPPESAEDRVLVAQLAAQVQQTIADLLHHLLANRRSVIFG